MKQDSILRSNGVNYIVPFVLITSCFALWGFANDITNPMVKAFSKIFRMSVTDGTLIQVAFYGGYFAMAFPAAMFIRKYSYKAGVLLGLGLYGLGAFLFYPAMLTGMYFPFLIAYFILTCGLSFLETSCNPYILTMGPESSATRRLNMAQCFNPMGSLLGMYVAMNFIQNSLDPMETAERAQLDTESFAALRDADLWILVKPYLAIGAVVVLMMVLIAIVSMPRNGDKQRTTAFLPTIRRIFSVPKYREGVIAQFFYVGAQVMCWTFIIQYGTHVFMSEGMDERSAEILSQKFNIAAMICFTCSRFVCTWFLKYIAPGRLLSILGILAAIFSVGAIVMTDRSGVYCLVGISACMSLMFPTIYGIALRGLGDNVKFGSAGLIMSILGGSVFPPLQALVIDSGVTAGGLPSTNLSFAIPLICFIVITAYGTRAYRRTHSGETE